MVTKTENNGSSNTARNLAKSVTGSIKLDEIWENRIHNTAHIVSERARGRRLEQCRGIDEEISAHCKHGGMQCTAEIDDGVSYTDDTRSASCSARRSEDSSPRGVTERTVLPAVDWSATTDHVTDDSPPNERGTYKT